MAYRMAGIDVHKRMLAVVVADVEVEGEYQFERRRFGTTSQQLRALAEWLLEREVEEARHTNTKAAPSGGPDHLRPAPTLPVRKQSRRRSQPDCRSDPQ